MTTAGVSWKRLIFDVRDSGTAADVAQMHADHRLALEVYSDRVKDIFESGRGLALIQELMDSFEYPLERSGTAFA
jgi:anti-sigma regulatory factor (Ser/Thr protein kinase)